MTDFAKLDEWRAWRDAERRKHRVMTVGEYKAWCRGGDAISHPSQGNAFPGGLTIELNTPPIIGRSIKTSGAYDMTDFAKEARDALTESWERLEREPVEALARRMYAAGMAKAGEIARAAFDEYTEKHQAAVLADNERLYQALSLAMAASSKIAEAILAASPPPPTNEKAPHAL